MRSFPGRAIPPETMAAFSEFSVDGDDREEMDGGFETDHGAARYRAVRLTTGSDVGAFFVTILPVGGRREITELQTYGVLVTLGVVLLAGISAWFLSGRVLAPVRNLTRTARSISREDRSGRLPVTGTSETVEMAETFNAMLDRLEGVYQSQLEFLRGAGHELRTPLTVAMGHLELVGDDEEQREATIAIVTDELGRMGRIVDDLQSLAESTHPDFVIRRELDLEPLAHDLLLKASALGDRRWQLDEAAEGTIVADRDRLVEAALNLADNAVKNSEPDDTIAIGVGLRGEEVHIWVRDTGVGISLAEQQRIFERFMRGDAAGRRYRGAGLGLAVVATIAEAHGGRVDLDSEPGAGSIFTIVIPQGGS
jgi:signal transduction histidine kinase